MDGYTYTVDGYLSIPGRFTPIIGVTPRTTILSAGTKPIAHVGLRSKSWPAIWWVSFDSNLQVLDFILFWQIFGSSFWFYRIRRFPFPFHWSPWIEVRVLISIGFRLIYRDYQWKSLDFRWVSMLVLFVADDLISLVSKASGKPCGSLFGPFCCCILLHTLISLGFHWIKHGF